MIESQFQSTVHKKTFQTYKWSLFFMVAKERQMLLLIYLCVMYKKIFHEKMKVMKREAKLTPQKHRVDP